MLSDRGLRVLQGVTGQAGQPHAIASGLRKLGIEAQSCTVAISRYGYPSDITIELSHPRSLARSLEQLTTLLQRFDVFHFHARSFLTEWPNQGHPSLLDLLALKLMGKRLFFHFRGQEIRFSDEFKACNPFHYVDEPESAAVFRMMPDASKRRTLDFLGGVCDGLFVVDPELQTYVPSSIIVPRALDEDAWPYVGVSDRLRPLIVHAPSRRGFKGTDSVLAAIKALEDDGLDFEFRLVEQLEHAEAAAVYRQADIVIDQLRIGWYGVLATEALALGKPTIAYIRDDLWSKYGDELPIINANPHTVTQTLRALVQDVDLRRRISATSREYFLRTHAATKVARDLERIYRDACGREKIVDWAAVGRFLDHQTAVARAAGMAMAKKTRVRAEQLASKSADELPSQAAPTAAKGLFSPPLQKVPFRILRRVRAFMRDPRDS